MSILIPSLLALVTAIITSFIGYYITKSKMKQEIVVEQKYKYFLPFKSCAEEFRWRLKHVESRLSEKSEKQQAMITRFDQKFETRSKEWYFNDDIGPNGGYFITSTIYLNCLFFYWIKRIQTEFPYMDLKCKKSLDKIVEKYYMTELDRYVKSKEFENVSRLKSKIKDRKGKCFINDFIRHIKFTIGRVNGIPYAMQDSLGDYVFDSNKNKLRNYDEFCDILNDKNSRIKFTPLIKFWIGLNSNDEVSQKKIDKIRAIILMFEFLGCMDIKN